MTTKHRRKFLEGHPEELGYIAWKVGHEAGNHWTFAHVILADCRRTIQLDFDFYDAEEQVARLRKIDSLIEELQAFRKALEEVPL